KPGRWIAAGRLPRSPSRAAHAGGQRCPGPSVKYRTVGSGSPCEWAWPGRRGFKRRWRDTRVTVGTTFRRRSRVFLVGELSKFPLPYDGWGGKCFSSFARGAAAVCRQRHPEPPGRGGNAGSDGLRSERCRCWRLGSSLHKHPHSSTCPRLPAPLAAASRGPRRESSSWSYSFASYLPSQLKGQDLRLGALTRPTVRVPHRGRRGRASGVWHFPPWCPELAGTHLPAAVHRGQKGISCSSPLLEFTSVATNF
ncbi:killin, partial [Meles meles]|uniref:killin n=1 Tax=Meles meles TaxID=9662 RepID=UPI001E6996AA